MNATLAPFTCPHGAYQSRTELAVVTVYLDGCRTVGMNGPRRFWCGEGEMSKPDGVLVTAGEYLRDWSEALLMDFDAVHGTGEYLTAWSEALREDNERWLVARKREEDNANYLRDWDEALVLNAGDELYDEAAEVDECLEAIGYLLECEQRATDHAAANDPNALEHAE